MPSIRGVSLLREVAMAPVGHGGIERAAALASARHLR